MIELEHIQFAYPGQSPLLKEINAVFPQKQITTILGPNGCGKSTLLKIACRLLKPSAGRVLLRGQDIYTMKTKQFAQQISLLSQTNHPPEIPVEDLVAYGRYPHQTYGQKLTAQDRIIIDHAISLVKADNYRQRPVSQLSGGQRQRAYIAMALAQDTDVIFLDEPTTYLDIHIRFEIMDLIRHLNQQGKTIIMVLHDLNLALEYSHQIILLDRGEIQIQGTPQQILQSGLLDRIFHVRTHIFYEDNQPFYHFAKEQL